MDPVKPTTEAKVPAKRSKARSHYLPLHKPQFYHSRTGQPLSLEEVMSDRDNENDVDDVAEHLAESQMPNDSMDENEIVAERFIKLWNSFVKKQRIVADYHIPWACEAFSRLHLQELRSNLALDLCWRQFMIKQWDYGILDAVTMNKCNTIIYRNITDTNDDINNNNNNTRSDDMDVVDGDKNKEGDKETTETGMCRNGEKDEMNVGEQGNNRLTLCEQMESATVTESSQDVNAITFINQRSFGKRPIIPTQKMVEWQWTSFDGRRSGGRRGRGRQGRGGRGRGRESGSGSGSGSGNLN